MPSFYTAKITGADQVMLLCIGKPVSVKQVIIICFPFDYLTEWHFSVYCPKNTIYICFLVLLVWVTSINKIFISISRI